MASEATSVGPQLDDCWNRIGVRGDRSCPRLLEHVHCRNCEVFEAAAAWQRDRLIVEMEESPPEPPQEVVAGHSHVMFRVGGAWLAIRTKALDSIVEPSQVHALPHARMPALMGVTNVHGTLAPCFDLRRLLQLEAPERVEAGVRVVPQVLIFGNAHGRVALPVDEVAGIERVSDEGIQSRGRSSAEPLQAVAAGVMVWRGRSVTLIDRDRLAARLAACFE